MTDFTDAKRQLEEDRAIKGLRKARLARVRHARELAKYEGRQAELRSEIEATGSSPYERAVRRIERVTGVPREKWEFESGHRYAKLALDVAKSLAKVAA